jgi:hypothetical protein
MNILVLIVFSEEMVGHCNVVDQLQSVLVISSETPPQNMAIVSANKGTVWLDYMGLHVRIGWPLLNSSLHVYDIFFNFDLF